MMLLSEFKKFLSNCLRGCSLIYLLYEHIHSSLQKNVLYMSPTIQKEMIDFIAKHVIQERMIS